MWKFTNKATDWVALLALALLGGFVENPFLLTLSSFLVGAWWTSRTMLRVLVEEDWDI